MNLSGGSNQCVQDRNKGVQEDTGNDNELTDAMRIGGFMDDKGLVEKRGDGARCALSQFLSRRYRSGMRHQA